MNQLTVDASKNFFSIKKLIGIAVVALAIYVISHTCYFEDFEDKVVIKPEFSLVVQQEVIRQAQSLGYCIVTLFLYSVVGVVGFTILVVFI
jgi:hypothetical protein